MIFIYSLFCLLGCGIGFIFSEKLNILIILIILVSLGLKFFRRYCLLKGMIILFFSLMWTKYHINKVMKFQLPRPWEGVPLIVKGKVEGIPHAWFSKDKKQKNIFLKIKSSSICLQNQCLTQGTMIRLQGKNLNTIPKAGETWQFPVKIKRIHGAYNEGVLGKEYTAFREGIRAEGKIFVSENHYPQKIKNASWWSIDAKREMILNRLKQVLPHTETAHWIVALLIGERYDVMPAEWWMLRKTGTNHLFAIAGLHLGILAAMLYFSVRKILRWLPILFHYYPLPYFVHSISCAGILIYSAASGFSIPTVRAFLMYVIFIGSIYARLNIHAWAIWSLALIVTLISNPFAILYDSFWLSFVIIACLIFYFKNRIYPAKKNKNYFYELCLMQFVIGIGVCAFSIYFYSEISCIGFAANLIAVPWLEFMILPVAWFGLLCLNFSNTCAEILFLLADKNIQILIYILNKFALFSFSSLEMELPIFGVIFIALLSFFLFLPRGIKPYFLILTGILAVIFYQKHNEVIPHPRLIIIDVGQGLAVLFETKHHTLMYDTGGAWIPFYDSGEKIIAPILLQHHRHTIDKLIISHGDIDHRGGAPYLIQHFSVKEIVTSAPKYFNQAVVCQRGETWKWDEVHFSMIFPEKGTQFEGNNASCVLKIEYGNHSILLPGDIEKAAQLHMLDYLSQLRAAILIAPHHGSKTSGQESWIKAVHPQHVVFSTGYKNKFHFPHASIVNQYRKLGAQLWNTSECGAIEFELIKNQTPNVTCHRKQFKRIWLDQPLSDEEW